MLATGAAIGQPMGGPTVGDVPWIAIMADFSDRPGIGAAASFTQLVQGNGVSSLGDYYTEVSYGQFNLLGSLNTTDGWSWSQSACCATGQFVGPISGPPGAGSLPNLKCYQPGGWSGSIVVSSESGTHLDDSPLYSNQVLYIDWAVINDSAVGAGLFRVAFDIDGVEARSWTVSGLAAGYHVYVQDYQLCALRPGAHTLTVRVDVDNRVSESDEADNSCNKSVTVDPVGASPEWYRLPQTHAYYANHSYGLGAWPTNHQKLVADAVVAADPYVDYSQFDYDEDGEVDYLVVIHAGTGAEVTGSPDDLWSWQGELSYGGGTPVVVDGVTVDHYAMIPERQGAPCDVHRLLGVLAHEIGHLLGLPDLYDTDESSYGMGRWCLMAYGCQANWGATPVHPCAWAKAQLGWLTPVDVATSIYDASIPALGTSPTAYRLRNHSLAEGEYFLVENRQRVGFDLQIPGTGLLICHVDDNQISNDSEWYCPDHISSGHAIIAAEQADGLWNLERKQNQGDGGDSWPGTGNHRNFSGVSTPNSRSYGAPNPCQSIANSISVSDISDSAMTMTADLMTNAPPVCLMSAPSAACPLTPLTFTSNSWDPDGTIVDWAWDFGDGGTADGEVVTHVYPLPNSYLVVLVVTDDDGATSTCSKTVVVVDGTPPTLTCPGDIAVGTDAESCQAVLDPGEPTCEDNCGTCTFEGERSDGNPLGDPYPVGTTTITWTATDAIGNIATCRQTITVTDDDAPVVSQCPSDRMLSADADCQATIPALTGEVSAVDNCDSSLSITQSPSAGTQVGLGEYTVTITIADDAGNEATCTAVVTVADQSGPTLSVPEDVVVNTDPGSCQASSVDLGTASCLDSCSECSISNDAPASFPLGSTVVTWTATDDAGNSTSLGQTVTVLDNETPVIGECPDDRTMSANASCQAAIPNLVVEVVASDNCDTTLTITQSPTPGVMVGLGDHTVDITVADDAGNTATCAAIVTVVDDTLPVVTPPPMMVFDTDPDACQASGVDVGTATCTDNCGTCTVVGERGDGLPLSDPYPYGVTIITWTATDDAGNQATRAQLIIVEDTVAPVIAQCASNKAVDANGSCQAAIPPLTAEVVASDNCDQSLVVVQSPAAGTIVNLGTHEVTLTAIDDSGNSASCIATVTVVDAAPPIIIECASEQMLIADASCRAALPDLTGEVQATDNCDPSPLVTQSPAPGTLLNLGESAVTLTVTDAAGNSESCMISVTVMDATAPTIVCPADVAVDTDPGACQASDVQIGSATCQDNCNSCSVSATRGDGQSLAAPYPLGQTIVTWTATDNALNQSICTQTVTVSDGEAPSLSQCASDQTLPADENCQAAIPDLTGEVISSDNCDPSPTITQSPTAGTLVGLGDTTVTLTVTDDAGNSTTCTATVTVVDDTAPTVGQCATNKTLSADATCQAAIPDLTGEVISSDNCDPSPTITQWPMAGMMVGLGDTTVTLTVTDDDGNQSTCQATVTVVDDTPPTIVQCANDRVLVANGTCQAEVPDLTGEVVASDECDGNFTVTQSPTAGTMVGLGDNTVTLTVTDNAGNQSSCTAMVRVIDATAPTISQCATDKTLSADAACQAAIPDLTGEVVAADNCDTSLTITQSPTAGTLVGLGDTTVTLTVTDDNGNSTTCTATVTVVDDSAPTISQCATDKTLSADATCQAVIPDLTGEVVATDNCDTSLTTTQSPTAGTLVGLGDTTVTLTVTDDAGNQTTCTATVTVVDDTPPTISECAGDKTLSADATCQAAIPDLTGEVVATDDCDTSLTVTQSPTAGTLVGLGDTTVTLTVTDDSGNNATCTATVTVVDDTAPTISECAGDKTLSADATCQAAIPDLTAEVVASDKCDSDLTVTQAPAAGTPVDPGSHLVTLTVRDDSGNSTDCTATITVVDDAAPSLSQCASDQTLSADASCQAAIPDLTLEVIASDNCDPSLTMTQSPTAGTLVGLGDTTVTLTVTDDAGNSAACTATVTVVDDTAPTISQCATNKTLSADATCQAAIPDLTGEVISSDNCDPSPTITQWPMAGMIVGLGDTTVTLTVTDDAGNQSTCQATVTVVDDTPPTIVQCANDRVLVANGTCQAEVPDLTGEVVASDECDGNFTVTQSPTAGTMVGLGDNTVTLTVTDNAGNQSTCTAMVRVIDATAPTISQCATDKTLSADANCEAAIPDVTGEVVATDNCDTSLTITQSPTAGTLVGLGDTTVTLTATDDNGNSATCTATVTVVDDSAPTITQCATDKTLSADATCQAVIPDLTGEVVATDNCDTLLTTTQSPTAGTLVGLGDTTVTLTVTDDAGNQTTCTATVTVVDDTPPTISECAGDKTLSADATCQAAIPDLTGEVVATDDCDTSLTVTQSPTAGTMVGLGDTTVTLTVTDDAGLTDTCAVTVTVVDSTPPAIECPPDLSVGTSPGACQAVDLDIGTATCSDNCGGCSVAAVRSDGKPLTDPYQIGTTTITWTATDDVGLTASCQQSVTVADLEPPTITKCAPDSERSIDTDCMGSIPKLWHRVVANDNCDSTVTVTQSPPQDTQVPAGAHIVTLTASDDSGNYSTCTCTVTIVDNVAPTITQCAGNDTISTTESCEAPLPDLTGQVTADDNCPGTLTVTQAPAAGTPAGVGDHIVTITVTDEAGNSSTCTATVTVVEDAAPVISQCAGDKTLSADATCQAVIPDLTGEVVATDNCDISLAITQSPTAGTLVGLGDTTVTLTVTDDSGNSATCTATVTVVDDTAPAITQCASDKTLSADAACQAAIPNLTGEVSASDNCDTSLTITQSPTAGTLVGLGDHTVTITVADDSGNSAACTATVTVVDDTPPTINECAGDKTLSADANCQALIPDLTGEVVASDNCDPSLTVTQSPTAGTLVGLGDTTVTLTVTDDSGNSAACTATVTVVDDTAPAISQCAGDKTLSADASCEAMIPDLTGEVVASDNCGPSLTITQSPTAGTLVGLGDTTVTLTVADDSGNSATCTATVTVIDDAAPAISQCAGDKTLSADANCQAAIPDLTGEVVASDDCDTSLMITQSPTAGTVAGLGDTTVTLTVTDDAGNSATCTATVTVVDDTAPAITECAGSRTLWGGAECQAMLPDLTGEVVASDACGSVTLSQNPMPGTVLGEGDHVITFTASDLAGNTSTCTALVTVVCEGDRICFNLVGPCWHLITVPCDPIDPHPEAVFRDEYGNPIPISGNLHRYDGTQYVTYVHFAPTPFGMITAGDGYWLYVFEDTTVCYEATCPSGPGEIEMAATGWHLVGPPGRGDVWFGDLLVYHAGMGPTPFANASGSWLQDPFIAYVCGYGYVTAGVLETDMDHVMHEFFAYWVYTFVDDVRLEIPQP